MTKYSKSIRYTFAIILTVSVFGVTSVSASSYTVKSGDSLWKIATDNKTTIANIKNWNGLKSDLIYAGQSLIVKQPQTGTSNTIYKVQNGDTLYKIALKYKTTVKEIKDLNVLKTDVILVGQSLKVPVKTVENNNQPAKFAKVHKVTAGEYLSVIAKKYGITVSELKRLNGLNTDMIYVGQELKVSDGLLPTPLKPTFLVDSKFPLDRGSYLPFGDTWNDSRTFGGDRGHEGVDIMAPIGTPIYSATDGRIVSYGWNELGGWRISIKTPEGYNLYYAHMSKYASGMGMGAQIKKGQLIGYVGNTGYGLAGTSGKFDSHLHVGMYDSNWKPMNPYTHLKYWESQNK